jgi:hypothetical protein
MCRVHCGVGLSAAGRLLHEFEACMLTIVITEERSLKIRILYLEGCPHHEPTLERLLQATDAAGIEAEIELVEVLTADQAKELRFLGSPTVQIDGKDIEPEAETRSDYGISCRIYGPSGVPPLELIEAAIRMSLSS